MIDQDAAVEHIQERRCRRIVKLHRKVLAVPTLQDVRGFYSVRRSGEGREERSTDFFDDSQVTSNNVTSSLMPVIR